MRWHVLMGKMGIGTWAAGGCDLPVCQHAFVSVIGIDVQVIDSQALGSQYLWIVEGICVEGGGGAGGRDA